MDRQKLAGWLRGMIVLVWLLGATLSPWDRALAQTGSGPLGGFPQVLRFERISLDQGLSQSTVTAILQDRQGFLWFATQDGLNRYDGINFQVYKSDPDTAASLPSQYIHALAEDRNGDLWIATSSGLAKLERSTGRVQRFIGKRADPTTLSSNMPRQLHIDRRGMLWVGTLNGLNQLDPASGKVTRYLNDPQNSNTLSHNIINAIAEDREGILWIGTPLGINRLDPTSGQVTHYVSDPKNPASLGTNTIYAVWVDQAGMVWAGGEEGGLSRLDPASGNVIRYWNSPYNPRSLSANTIQAIQEDLQGTLWIGTSGGGLNRMDRERGEFEIYRSDPGDLSSMASNFISSLYEDRSGVLWVGTEGGGVNKLIRQADMFQHVRVGSDTTGGNAQNRDVIWSFYQDEGGRLYVGTNGGGLSRFDPNTRLWRHFQYEADDPDTLSDNVVIALAPAPDGKVWVATTRKGLNLFDPISGRAQRYRRDEEDPQGIGSDFLLTLLTDRSGRLWIGTANNGVDLLDPVSGQFTHFRPNAGEATSLASGTVRGIYESRDGTIWICTDGGGLNTLNPVNGQVTRILADAANPNSLSSNSLFSIYEDHAGIFWIGTVGGGLNRYDRQRGTFKTYREKDGLPNNVVYGVLEDRTGMLWISTNNGLARFDPKTEVFTPYGIQDGLQSREFNNNAYYQTADGLMLFGGINGFNLFDPAHLGMGNLYQPPVVLTSLTRAGRPLLPDKPAETIRAITLTWPDNSFEFEFVGLNYIHSERNRYAYRLENFDANWIQTGVRHFGQYTNLPGGTYTLRLKAANNSGLWNEEGVAIRVTVVPPFWQTGWFALGLFGFVSLSLLTGYRLRMRSATAHAARLHRLVEERTQDLEQRNSEVARRAEQFRVINDVGHQITSILDSQQLINAIAGTVQRAFGYDLVSIWLVEGSELIFRACAGSSEAPERVKMISRTQAYLRRVPAAARLAPWTKPPLVPPGRWVILAQPPCPTVLTGADALRPPRLSLSTSSVATQVVASGEARLVLDVSREPAYLRWPATSCTRSELTLPLKAKSGVIGILNVESNRLAAFDESDRLALQALANQVAIAVENAYLYEQSRQTAVAEERNRLARELHDAVTQTLFSASLIAEALPAAWESDPKEGRDLLAELRQLSRGALAEMRTLLMELRPSVLAESNLEDLLRQLADAVIGREGIRVNFSIEGKGSLPGEVRIVLYRIGQEALNNVSKHARASQVSMVLRYLGVPGSRNGNGRCGAMLTVQDNGRGFDPERVSSDHLGLKIMSERAQAIGGTLAVESQAGQGTQITVLWEEAEEEK